MDNDESHLNVSVTDCESEIHKTASVIHYMYVYIGPWGNRTDAVRSPA